MGTGLTSKWKVVGLIDEIQGLLAKLMTKRCVTKPTRVMEAEAKGRVLGMKLGAMIEKAGR